MVITIIFSGCFLERAVIFLYRPVSGGAKISSEALFYTLAYYLPELVPNVLQLYLAESTVDKQAQDAKFINDLYENSQDSIDDINSTLIGSAKVFVVKQRITNNSTATNNSTNAANSTSTSNTQVNLENEDTVNNDNSDEVVHFRILPPRQNNVPVTQKTPLNSKPITKYTKISIKK